jgi:c-di-GMP-binding flagellar brake protein YcgR
MNKLDSAELRVVIPQMSCLYSIPARYDKRLSLAPRAALRVQLYFAQDATIQRREYFRLRTKEAVSYLPQLPNAEGQPENWRAVMTNDISGSGLSLRAREALPIGTLMKVRLYFAGRAEPIAIDARVVSVVEIKSHATAYKIGAQFVNLNESVRREIVGYLNSRQTGKLP